MGVSRGVFRRAFALASFAVAVAGGAAAPAAAQDPVASLTLGVSPSTVVEDGTRSFSVDASGNAPAPSTLEVRLVAGSACPGAPSGASVGTRPVDGTFSGVRFDGSFSPTAAGTWSVCGYLPGLAEPARAGIVVRAPSISLSMSLHAPELIEGAEAQVSISGSAEVARTVFVFARATSSCAASAADEAAAGAARLIEQGPATSFSGTAAFVIPGLTSRLCAYVGESAAASSLIREQGLTSRAPNVRGFSLTPSSSSTVDDVGIELVAAAADTEVPRLVYLFAQPQGTGCAATPAEQRSRSRTTEVGGSIAVQFSFRKVAPFSPYEPGRWLLCGYVGRDEQTTNATAQAVVDVRPPVGSLSIEIPSQIDAGDVIGVGASGSVDGPRTVHVFLGHDRVCAPTAAEDYANPSVVVLTGSGVGVGPGSFDVRREVDLVDGGTLRVCAYLSERTQDTPVATATALIAPRGGTAPPPPPPPGGGGTPPGTVPGGVVPVPQDTGRIPDSIGKTAVGGFYVNNTVMPPGVTAARFVELARRSGERWGYKFRGVTRRGAAKRDGIRVVGFSSVVKPEQHSRIVVFTKRARPKGCTRATSRSRRCKPKRVVVERDVALARKLPLWWDGAGPPPPDRMDVESALLRIFGALAGNKADRPACSGSPLLRSTGVTPGWWWRGPADHFRPRCPIT